MREDGSASAAPRKSPRWERLAFPKSLATRISPSGGFLADGTPYRVRCPTGFGKVGSASGEVRRVIR